MEATLQHLLYNNLINKSQVIAFNKLTGIFRVCYCCSWSQRELVDVIYLDSQKVFENIELVV